MIKALLCDFDGTLANTLPLYVKAYKNTLHVFGFDYSDAWIYKHCFGRTEEAVCNELGVPERVKDFQKIYFSMTNTFSNQVSLFEDVKSVLIEIKKRKIKLAVVSFALRWYIEKMVKDLKLEEFFDLLIAFEDVKNPKPAPDAVLKACNEFGISPSESIVIGDAKNDIFMGKSAGAKTALFFPIEHEDVYDINSLKQTNPDYIIHSWKELEKIL